MRDEIWKASTEAKYTQIYTEITCQFYKKISNIISIITILFSSGGVIMGLGFWKQGTILPFISCIIITLMQAIRLTVPKLFPSEKDYKKMDDVIAFYFEQHHELHKLWHEFENEEISEKIARERFFKITVKEKNMLKVVNDVLTDTNKRRKNKAYKLTRSFFNN